MKKKLVLIKLGGSLITDKRKPFTANPRNIGFFAKEFRKVRSENSDVDFVIGTGGGSFAHFPAHEYGLRDGARNQRQTYGMCVTHNAARKLSGIVAQDLTDQDVPAFTLSPAGLVSAKSGKVGKSELHPIGNLLSQNVVPILHGDTIYDHTRGTTILSTEETLHLCATEMCSSYKKLTVIYLFDADGVLDENGQVIPTLAGKDTFKPDNGLEHDVTKGLSGKIASARKTARYSDAVYIANGTRTGVLKLALNDGENVGTRIEI